MKLFRPAHKPKKLHDPPEGKCHAMQVLPIGKAKSGRAIALGFACEEWEEHLVGAHVI